MSQTDVANKKSFDGDGDNNSPYAWDKPLDSTDGLKVLYRNDADGVEYPKDLGDDYTIVIADDGGSADVTLVIHGGNAAPAEGQSIVLYLDTPLTQESSYGRHTTIEGDLDKLTQIALSHQEQIDRCLKMPVGDGEDFGGTAFITEIPPIEGATANDLLVVNSGKTALEYGSESGGGDVTAGAVIADNVIVRGDGGGKGIQGSGVLINDTDDMSAVNDITMTGDILSLSNGNITLTPHGTGRTVVTRLEAPTPVTNDTSTAFVPALVDAETWVTLSNSSAITCIFPANASVAFPIGTLIVFRQKGNGAVTFSVTSDSMTPTVGMTLVSNGASSVVYAFKEAATLWIISGDLVAS